MAKHEDLLGKKLELGDLITISSGYDGTLYVHIIAGFTEKGVSALTFYSPVSDDMLTLLERSLQKAQNGNKVCAGWSTGGWDSFWNMSRRIVKIEPETIFDKTEMKIYNQIKDILNGEERTEPRSIRL